MKKLLETGIYPHSDLKHGSEKPASLLIPPEETSACAGATWGRDEWERLFNTLSVLNMYV